MKEDVIAIGKGWFYALLCTIGVVVLIAVIYGVRYYSAETVGKVEMEVNTTDGRAQEFSYNRFFDQCAAIQGYEDAIASQRELLKTAQPDDFARINTNVGAITAERNRAIAQYNADARKIKTLARFKDNGLPDFIDSHDEKTSCQN